jgi:membrane protein implicated in regulation of membrane protease activity
MTWAGFYLLCFLVGFILSVVSFLSVIPHAHLPGMRIHHAGAAAGRGHGVRGGGVSPLNGFTITAFLAWFGGTGYLLTHYYAAWFAVGLAAAAACGLAGAGVVFWFLARVLVSREETLDPDDYDMVGVLGRLSSAIRPGGTGEIVFTQAGTRRSAGARSVDGSGIPKNTEVVVTRYERGIAYVRSWDELRTPTTIEGQ